MQGGKIQASHVITMVPLGIKVDWFPNTKYILQFFNPNFFFDKRWLNLSPFYPKLMDLGTNCSKIDGFTGTHANRATVS